jgi:hypothetical protein
VLPLIKSPLKPGRSLSHPPPRFVLPYFITDELPIMSAKGSLLLPTFAVPSPPLEFRTYGVVEAAAPNIFEKSSFLV